MADVVENVNVEVALHLAAHVIGAGHLARLAQWRLDCCSWRCGGRAGRGGVGWLRGGGGGDEDDVGDVMVGGKHKARRESSNH